ncbi:MAG: AAA family ATPase [Anaerolineaceae bacterium]|nr:AAA family ATPase [Anaerolineaceae bacterium]
MSGIPRIDRIFTFQNNSRFNLLYGPGLQDTFISASHHEFNIEEALLLAFKSQGFKRVVFFDLNRSIFFLDEESEKLTFPQTYLDQKPLLNVIPEKMQFFSEGPMHSAFVIKPQTDLQDSHKSGIRDVFVIRLMDTIMRQNSDNKTALVFLQAETTLRFFQDQRTLASLLGSWSLLPASNPNRCFLLFSADNQNQLREISQRISIPEIRNLIQIEKQTGTGACIEIGLPDQKELLSILEMIPEKHSNLVEGLTLDEMAIKMYAEDQLVRTWIGRLLAVDSLQTTDGETLKWFENSGKKSGDACKPLQDMVGLKDIKRRVEELFAWLKVLKEREALAEENFEMPSLHMLFSGNPGTGKTSVARLLRKIYKDIGVLKRGHLVEVNGNHLIADHVGGTAIKTNQVIEEALDGILFIDEAYMLTEPDRGGFGQEALDTLMTRMENDRDRLVVIAAGYPQKMKQFQRANPGLTRRFPEDNIFEFPDFSPEELLQIITQLFNKNHLLLEDSLEEKISKMLQQCWKKRDETFGNAGEMRNLFETVDRRRAIRLQTKELPFNSPVIFEDFPENYCNLITTHLISPRQVMEKLDRLIGLQSVKQYISKLTNRMLFEKRKADQRHSSFMSENMLEHFLFIGNPGTGKNSVARLIGEMYYALGLLDKGHCVEVSQVDLVAGYVGQTAIKTLEKIKDAFGGVLFIDEAYALAESQFGRESINTLVKAMEDYRGRFVVIAAGYPHEMQHFVEMNAGLRSRFSESICFPDFSEEELKQIFLNLAANEDVLVSNVILDEIKTNILAAKKTQGRSFGNARYIRSLYQKMKNNLAQRYTNEKSFDTHSIEIDNETIQFIKEDVIR